MDRLLTIEDVTDLLQVKKSYVYHLTHTRQIPFVKIGNHVRFRRADLEDWLASQLREDRSGEEGHGVHPTVSEVLFHGGKKARK